MDEEQISAIVVGVALGLGIGGIITVIKNWVLSKLKSLEGLSGPYSEDDFD